MEHLGFPRCGRNLCRSLNKSTDTRPFTISSPVDRIVHRTITDVLEQVFEPIFLSVSYGFRPCVSTHSFFSKVQRWKGIKCVIHADVRKCFDQIKHSLLIRLLKKHIADNQFLDLIQQFLSTPILDRKGKIYTFTDMGIPQGAVFSPILMNVVLTELDMFAMSLCQQRIESGRFADDCTIGIRGNSDTLARSILDKLSQFLRKELELSFRSKFIYKRGTILGATFVLPIGEIKGDFVKIEVPMDRIKYNLAQKGSIFPNKSLLFRLGNDPYAICNQYKAIALGLLNYVSEEPSCSRTCSRTSLLWIIRWKWREGKGYESTISTLFLQGLYGNGCEGLPSTKDGRISKAVGGTSNQGKLDGDFEQERKV